MLIQKLRQFGGLRLLWGYAHWGMLGFILRECLKCIFSGQSVKSVYPKIVSLIEPKLKEKYYRPLPDISELKHEPSNRIWFCWLQGLDKAPEMVQICHKQLELWFPEYEITVITQNNFKDWVTIPDYIEEKWQKRRMPAALFSDILRLELLIKHGGTWVDASVLCTGWEKGSMNDVMIHKVMQSDLFLYRYANPKTKTYQGISNWFISARTNNGVLMAIRDMVYAYWKDNDCVLVYHMFHLFFDMLVKDNPDILTQMPVGYSVPSLKLGDHLKDDYKPEAWQKLTEKICIHKLNYRKEAEARKNPKSYYCLAVSPLKRSGVENLFFELLQVAVGNRERLSEKPTDEQWVEIRDMAKKQAVNAITYAAMERLPQEQWPERYFRLRWGGQIQKTVERNEHINKRCVEVVRRFQNSGFWCCILKGQGNLFNYPEWLKDKRTPGDIDVWVRRPSKSRPSKQGGLEGLGSRPIRQVVDYCQHIKKAQKVGYIHLDFNVWKDVEMEVHIRPSFLCSPLRNHRLQKYFLEQQPTVAREDTPFPVPNNEFNAVFQLMHIYKHLYEEGIGLRQMLDYYFVLQNLEGQDARERVMEVLRRTAVDKFAGAVMYVLSKLTNHNDNVNDNLNPNLNHNDSFASTKTKNNNEKDNSNDNFNDNPNLNGKGEWMLCEPDVKRGEHLLKEIMLAGNFGMYDERNGDLTNEGHAGRYWRKTKRAFRLMALYPHEAIWQPYFMTYHILWRGLKLWRWE